MVRELPAGTLTAAPSGRDAAEGIVIRIDGRYDGRGTDRGYRGAIRVFGCQPINDEPPASLD